MSVDSVPSKIEALKRRKLADAELGKKIDDLVRVHVENDPPSRVGCFGRAFRSCGFARARTRVPTVEAAPEAAPVAASSKTGMGRLFGAKSARNQQDKIATALATVSTRLEALRTRVAEQKRQAVVANQAGQRETALRELRKAKSTAKQVSAAEAALEALERQQDLLSETELHKELTSALASTNLSVKSKQKGLLNASESAVDTAQELRDQAEDVAAVFEGIAPAVDQDDDELLEELEELMNEGNTAPTVAPPAPAPQKEAREDESSGWEQLPAAGTRDTTRAPLLATAV